MIARAEMSTNVQGSDAQGTGAKVMSVAVIGPNDAHRSVVAQALTSAQGRKVHEFIDYPADLNDLARMMETKFDVVLVDVDTDESYALQIIAKLADFGPAVMAYSARTDQELLASCMRAGACDFLPLPSENGNQTSADSKPQPAAQQVAPKPQPTPAVQQVVPKAQPATGQQAMPQPQPTRPVTPVSAAPVAPVRSNVTPILPERRNESVTEVRPRTSVEDRPAPSTPRAVDVPPVAEPESLPAQEPQNDFAAWDAANLRPPTQPTPAVQKQESRPRPALVPDRKKSEPLPPPPPPPAPEVDELFAPAPIERPPVPVDIFRSTIFRAESEPDEAAEKQGAKLVKWILIAAGPIVLGLVLLIVFTRSSASTAPASTAKASVPEAAPSPGQHVVPGSQLIVDATGKSTAAQHSVAKPSPDSPESTPAPQPAAAPVSPDAMAQQLVAPSRIAGAIKKTSAGDAAPPTAPAPVAFDENNALPGAVFGSSTTPRVAPHSIAISAGIAEGMIIHKTAPTYPRFAQEAHISGRVVLKATINKQGNIEGVQVLSGPKILAPAAVDAVKTWKYRPYMLDNQPIAVETNITIVFGGQGN